MQLNYAYAQKAETLDFLETVRNIAHDDVFVQLRITGGTTQNFTIDGNPSNIDAPTIQIVKFTLPRQSTTPGILPLKIGDEYFACISLKGTEAQLSAVYNRFSYHSTSQGVGCKSHTPIKYILSDFLNIGLMF